MKKNLLLVSILFSNLCFCEHNMHYRVSELANSTIIRYHTEGDTIAVGDQKYWYMVGGIYNDGNIKGIVYYINEELGIMKICEPKSSNTYYDKEYHTSSAPYNTLVNIYKKNGKWELPTIQEMKIYGKNMHLIHYNKTWKDGETYLSFGYNDVYWTKSKDENGLVLAYSIGYDITYSVELFDSENHLPNAACARGTKDVPFNLSLISQYELPD